MTAPLQRENLSCLPASGSPIIGSNYCDPYILLLYTGVVMQDLAVDQHSTWNGSALNHPYRGYPVTVQPSTRDATPNALHCLCLVSDTFYTCLCQLATVLGHVPHLRKYSIKLEDSYQTYLNTYKTHDGYPPRRHRTTLGEGTLTPRNKTLILQMTISMRTLMILRMWKMKTTPD